jgi:triacylglycerol esterase/lipase EstA (alpha/beta hydrolase family)
VNDLAAYREYYRFMLFESSIIVQDSVKVEELPTVNRSPSCVVLVSGTTPTSMVPKPRGCMLLTSLLVGIIASVISLNNRSLLKGLFGLNATRYMTPPVPPIDNDGALVAPDRQVHLVVLVHGIYGNPDEVGTIRDILAERSSASHLVLVHSALSNYEKTTDGIVEGGKRLAREVNEWLADVKSHTATQKISLSFVGNSLGGLYCRYALALVDWTGITPAIFCTTATPHLGSGAPHTYLPIGSTLEFAAA